MRLRLSLLLVSVHAAAAFSDVVRCKTSDQLASGNVGRQLSDACGSVACVPPTIDPNGYGAGLAWFSEAFATGFNHAFASDVTHFRGTNLDTVKGITWGATVLVAQADRAAFDAASAPKYLIIGPTEIIFTLTGNATQDFTLGNNCSPVTVALLVSGLG